MSLTDFKRGYMSIPLSMCQAEDRSVEFTIAFICGSGDEVTEDEVIEYLFEQQEADNDTA